MKLMMRLLLLLNTSVQSTLRRRGIALVSQSCFRNSVLLTLDFLASLFNEHHYYLVTGTLSFSAAKTAAESISYLGWSGHLVTISSPEERQFLQSTFGNSKFWIAASDAQQEASWTWTSGVESGFEIKPTYWLSGQPNGGTLGNCAFMDSSQNGWDDQSCDSFLTGYVVEFECQSATASTCSRMSCLDLKLFILRHW